MGRRWLTASDGSAPRGGSRRQGEIYFPRLSSTLQIANRAPIMNFSAATCKRIARIRGYGHSEGPSELASTRCRSGLRIPCEHKSTTPSDHFLRTILRALWHSLGSPPPGRRCRLEARSIRSRVAARFFGSPGVSLLCRLDTQAWLKIRAPF